MLIRLFPNICSERKPIIECDFYDLFLNKSRKRTELFEKLHMKSHRRQIDG